MSEYEKQTEISPPSRPEKPSEDKKESKPNIDVKNESNVKEVQKETKPKKQRRIRRTVKKTEVWVQSTLKKDETETAETKDELIQVHDFATEPAYVEVRKGLTIKMVDDYEFGRVDITIKRPCYWEEIQEAQKEASALADEFLANEVEQVRRLRG